MANAQRRAVQAYRTRLSEQGLARFEVLGLKADRALVRTLARRLAEGRPEAERVRTAVSRSLSGEPPRTGGSRRHSGARRLWARTSTLSGSKRTSAVDL